MRRCCVHVVGGAVTVLIAVLAALSIGAPQARAAAESEFSIPVRLKPQVDFWISVFATYGKRQVIIHDTDNRQRIYSVLDLSDLDNAGLSDMQIELAMKDQEDAEKARIRSLLRRLDQVDPRTDYLTQEEERIMRLFADDPSPTTFSDAAGEDRLRGQRGLRERFSRGIQVAHAYFPTMEKIFRDEGVPPEITRLPLVESCFNLRAYSKV